jgi:hypothetical protein
VNPKPKGPKFKNDVNMRHICNRVRILFQFSNNIDGNSFFVNRYPYNVTNIDDGNDVVQTVLRHSPVIGSFQFQKWWGSFTDVVYELYMLCRELFSGRRRGLCTGRGISTCRRGIILGTCRRDLCTGRRGINPRRRGLFENMWGLRNPQPRRAFDPNTHALDTK